MQFPLDRARRAARVPAPATAFAFDVADPLSYLAAERAERVLGAVRWIAVDGAALAGGHPRGQALRELRAQAERRAAELRLPLVWPDRFPFAAPCARRASAHACELGAGPAFALALSRLAFCGGFPLDDPEVLAEAAAAAAVPLDACLSAARDTTRDVALHEHTALVRRGGVSGLPAVRVGGRWLGGEGALTVAVVGGGEPALLRPPLAPVG